MSEREWIHRATWPDGRVRETEPRIERPGQACFAGISELLMRRHNPGLTVVHLVREVGGEWGAVGGRQVSASLSTQAAVQPSAQGVDIPGPEAGTAGVQARRRSLFSQPHRWTPNCGEACNHDREGA